MAFILKKDSGYAVRYAAADKTWHQKSFRTKVEARRFLAEQELSPEVRSSSLRFSELLIRYRDNVTRHKRGVRNETLRINAMLRHPLAEKSVAKMTHKDIEAYIVSRKVAPATVRRELTLLSAVFNDAVRQGLMKDNPMRGVVRPREPEHRERIASEEDIARLLEAASWDGASIPESATQLVVAAFLLSCRTGMRSGEMMMIEEAWIDGRVIHIPAAATKTDSRRDIALSSEALRILNLVRAAGRRPKIFGINAASRDVLWRKVRDRAGLGPVVDSEGRMIREGLNFHDGRATFCTWAASPDPRTGAPRLDVLALARQTGHKNLKMLQRYYRATAEEIAERLG